MGWKLTTALLSALLLFDVFAPPDESGPANLGRTILAFVLGGFLAATCLAWALRGLIRSLIVLAMSGALWLLCGYLTFALVITPLSGWPFGWVVGPPATVGLVAGLVTVAGLKLWRGRRNSLRRKATGSA